MATNLIKLDPKNLNVGVLGYTGETGKVLTKEILQNNYFKSTILIGRRTINYEEDFYKNAKVVEFDKISEYDDAFKNLDVVYCCLGTTRGKSGAIIQIDKDGFRKVDFDYIVESAKVAKKNGCKQFHLVSSSGANKNSFLLYPQVKGLAEEAVGNMRFEKAAMYRPKLLTGPREESRPLERVSKILISPIARIAPTLFTTPYEILAKSMLANTIHQQLDAKNVEIIDNNRIFKLAELYDQSK